LRVGGLEAIKANELDLGVNATRLFRRCWIVSIASEADIVGNGESKEQPVIMKHDTAIRVGVRHSRAVDKNVAIELAVERMKCR
jgi:hypothetical protein